MPRATSDVEICNLALTELNQRLISSLDSEPEDSPQQTYCKLVYNTARRSILECYDWSFALNRVIIEPHNVYSTDEELIRKNPNLYTKDYFGWNTSYALPADCLKVSGVYDSEWRLVVNQRAPRLAWTKQGNFILTQEQYMKTQTKDESNPFEISLPKLHLQYVQDVEDVNRFSPSFIEAFALNIARKLTKQFNNSAAFLQFLDAKYDEALREAKTRDFRQTSTEGVMSYPILEYSYW